jgi:antitoxin CptB
MKELDVLLERFMARDYDRASRVEQAAFANLLTLPDPQLLDYLMGRATPPDSISATVVARISNS